MNSWDGKLDVVLVGGGMISQEVILPTIFQEQREGRLGKITVSSLDGKTIKKVQKLFPEKEFTPYPDPATIEDDEKPYPKLYKEALDSLGEHGCVMVATPDHLHTPIILSSLERGLDVIVEKPLCLKVSEVHQILKITREKGLYVYTDYHKRHDPAVRGAKYRFQKGELGDFQNLMYLRDFQTQRLFHYHIQAPLKLLTCISRGGKVENYEYLWACRNDQHAHR